MCLSLALVLPTQAAYAAAPAAVTATDIASAPAPTSISIPTSTPAITPPDKVTIAFLLEAASAHHPSLKSAQFQAQAAEQDIAAAERQQWPQVSLVAETNNNPDSVAASATRLARVQQTLWDFGRVDSLVQEAETSSTLTQMQIKLREQDLHIQVITAWQQLVAAYTRQTIAQQHVAMLNGYRDQMQRRVNAQASPQIDLELVESRVSQGQVELDSARSQLEHSVFTLQQLTGVANLTDHLQSLQPTVSDQAYRGYKAQLAANDWSAAAQQHPVVKAAELQYQVASQNIKTLSSEQYPQVYLRIDQPLSKTAYNNTKPSWFVGLNYAPSAGFSGLAQVQSQVLRAESARDDIATAKLDIQQTMVADYRDFSSSLDRLQALENSVMGAQKVLASYQRQFQAGRKSWLDLLNAARELSQSQYQLAEIQATLSAAALRLEQRLSAAQAAQ